MKVFLQRILQEIMKKNNTWNIRRLVDHSFVPSAQREFILDWRIYELVHFVILVSINLFVMLCVSICITWKKEQAV